MSRESRSRASDQAADRVITRRLVIGAGAVGAASALSACSRWTLPASLAPRADAASVTSAPATSTPSHAAPSDQVAAAGGTEAAAHVTSTPGAGLPTKAEIVARFGHRRPRAWGLNLPGEITSVPARGKAVALTFDACGGGTGSGYDERLIDLLRAHGVKATLNLNARWIAKNPSVSAELAADPLFRIANHGTRHRPLSTTGRSAYGIKGTSSLGELYDEVASAHDWIAQHCPHQPILFRSGTAYSDDIGVDVCRALGMPFLGYTLNGDGGTTFSPAQVAAALNGCRPGDIVISHMNHPERGTRAGYAAALPRLLDRGFTFTHVEVP